MIKYIIAFTCLVLFSTCYPKQVSRHCPSDTDIEYLYFTKDVQDSLVFIDLIYGFSNKEPIIVTDSTKADLIIDRRTEKAFKESVRNNEFIDALNQLHPWY